MILKTKRGKKMSIQNITSANAPVAAGPYSQAIKVGNFIYTSGQIPVDPNTGYIGQTIEEQSKQVLDNLLAVLAGGDAGPQDVVSTKIYLSDMKNFAAVNFVYMNYFKEPYPTRCCVEVSAIPKGVMIMIEAVAYKE